MLSGKEVQPGDVDVDVLIIGAGITGIYQLYTVHEAGFSVTLLEQGDGVGGTWFWNRYPGARFDSESYTYAYLFSAELYRDWYWSEHFAGQPETEKYMNHVVDRFDLRQFIRLGKKVTALIWDEKSVRWTVRMADGGELRARFVIAATGRLSAPYFPAVPGREDFRGISHHTGLWPAEPVDFSGKRVAVVGTGSSGVQLVPEIIDEVGSLTVYQRTPNWCTPLNNGPITPEEQAELRDNFESIRDTLNANDSGYLHAPPRNRTTFEDSEQDRQAFYEQMWNSKGFAKLTSNYRDLTTSPEANAEFSRFLAEKIRGIVKDPVVAEKLIPKDHGFAHKRPPYVTGYYEAFNSPKISLVDLKATPIVQVTETGIESADVHREFDIIVWATGFDFGTGALLRLGIRGRDGETLAEHWHNGPNTFLGLQSVGFPNFFFPGGPHGNSGNSPRAAGDMVDFVTETLAFLRDHGFVGIETRQASEDSWSAGIDERAARSPFTEISYFYGTNIPGKPRRYLLNPGSRSEYRRTLQDVIQHNYENAFVLTRHAEADLGV